MLVDVAFSHPPCDSCTFSVDPVSSPPFHTDIFEASCAAKSCADANKYTDTGLENEKQSIISCRFRRVQEHPRFDSAWFTRVVW